MSEAEWKQLSNLIENDRRERVMSLPPKFRQPNKESKMFHDALHQSKLDVTTSCCHNSKLGSRVCIHNIIVLILHVQTATAHSHSHSHSLSHTPLAGWTYLMKCAAVSLDMIRCGVEMVLPCSYMSAGASSQLSLMFKFSISTWSWLLICKCCSDAQDKPFWRGKTTPPPTY